jgi:hypothetical protein
MKGYPEYPDASDSSQRSLYAEKEKGHVFVTNKVFSLTQSGIDHTKEILERNKTGSIENSEPQRFSRTTDSEVARIKRLEGFGLFVSGKELEITENDVYRYLGVTPRTSDSSVRGRLATIKQVITELQNTGSDPLLEKIVAYNDFLQDKFLVTIDFFTRNN